MCLVVNASIWIVLSLIALATANPSCSLIYGRPSSDDCRGILDSFTRFGKGSRLAGLNFYAPPGLAKPGGVDDSQWTNRVFIPKFWNSDQYPGCRVALFPTITSADGLSYDVSRYVSIQSVGYGIDHYCVQALNMPGVQGTGGIDSAGDNDKLRLILYAPRSKFENDTVADYKQNKPIAIQDDTDDEKVLGIQKSIGNPRTKVRNLGDGWYMSYDSTTSILPPQTGAANLETFYTRVVNLAANQISTVINATENLAFSFKGLNLRLFSLAPINWTWVINFAADMLDNASNNFAVLFNGEAYSYYWEIAAVTAALTYV